MTTPNNLHGAVSGVKWCETYREELEEMLFFIITSSFDKFNGHLCVQSTINNGQLYTWSNGVMSYRGTNESYYLTSAYPNPTDRPHAEYWKGVDELPTPRELTTRDGFRVYQIIAQEDKKSRVLEWKIDIPWDFVRKNV